MTPATRAADAISRSARTNSITHIYLDSEDPALKQITNELALRSYDCANTHDSDGNPIVEFWGETAGEEWRVHVHSEVAR